MIDTDTIERLCVLGPSESPGAESPAGDFSPVESSSRESSSLDSRSPAAPVSDVESISVRDESVTLEEEVSIIDTSPPTPAKGRVNGSCGESIGMWISAVSTQTDSSFPCKECDNKDVLLKKKSNDTDT